MAKEPLVTRSQLRKHRQQETPIEETRPNPSPKMVKQSEKEYQKKEKEISNFYRKENKKNKPITKTRSGEKQKSRAMNNFLMKAIVIVFLLIVIVMMAVFFL